MRGDLITFEGIDGAGKSLQVKRLSAHLQQIGVPHIVTKQPGGTPLADEIRKVLLKPREETVHFMTELLLFASSRAQHINEVVLPALSLGKTVICDRFMDSVYAYDGARGHSMDTIRQLYRIVSCQVVPDLTFYLDITPEIGLQRILAAGHVCDRIEADREYQEKIRKVYLEIVAENRDRIFVVDGTLPEKDVTREIVAAWESRFQARFACL